MFWHVLCNRLIGNENEAAKVQFQIEVMLEEALLNIYGESEKRLPPHNYLNRNKLLRIRNRKDKWVFRCICG